MYQWGRKDCFPGADGSTISATVKTIPIYGANENALTEGSATGLRFVNITTSGVLNENISLTYAIKNPLTIIYNNSGTYDWYTNNKSYQNPVLWGDGDIKSIYDPCPKGWEIPADASSTFGDFATTTMTASGSGTNAASGRTYSHTAWFPTGGYRHSISGTLYYVGSRGYYWSASISSIYAGAMSYNMSGVYPCDYFDHARSFSVRCIQE